MSELFFSPAIILRRNTSRTGFPMEVSMPSEVAKCRTFSPSIGGLMSGACSIILASPLVTCGAFLPLSKTRGGRSCSGFCPGFSHWESAEGSPTFDFPTETGMSTICLICLSENPLEESKSCAAIPEIFRLARNSLTFLKSFTFIFTAPRSLERMFNRESQVPASKGSAPASFSAIFFACASSFARNSSHSLESLSPTTFCSSLLTRTSQPSE